MTVTSTSKPRHPAIALTAALVVSLISGIALAITIGTTAGTLIGILIGAFIYGNLRQAHGAGAWLRAVVIVFLAQLLVSSVLIFLFIFFGSQVAPA